MISKYLNKDVALLLGNGINRYESENNSWEKILLDICKNHGKEFDSIPKMFPYTEIFDVIISSENVKDDNLKKEFVKLLEKMEESKTHKKIIEDCREKGSDILTSNFDSTLEKAHNYVPFSRDKLDKGFTQRYPWQRYYSKNAKNNNEKKYPKVWHIQGDAHYHQSLRLTVKDYTYSCNHFNKYDPFNKKTIYHKTDTWVNAFFEKKLLIVGLALEEQEFFLRSLFYKKKKYIKDEKAGWYICCREDTNLFGKKEATEIKGNDNYKKLEFFAKAVGLELVTVDTWKEIYG